MADQNSYLPDWMQRMVGGLAGPAPVLPTAMQVIANSPSLPPLRAAVNNPATGQPIPVPPNVSLPQNMQRAASQSPNLLWFYNQVKTGSPWDFKHTLDQKYDDFGNVNYGATGTALGVPQQILDRLAGAYQIISGTSQPGWGMPWGSAPYGDDPNDQRFINQGTAYARQSST